MPTASSPEQAAHTDQELFNFNSAVNNPQTGAYNLNPNAPSFVYVPKQTYDVMPPNNKTTIPFTSELTQFLLKKELVLSRFVNFNDLPECYASWKAGFKAITNDLNVSPVEEIDLLIRWLGPDSTRHAMSLKSSNISNPSKGLHLIWGRLDERYGAPELVEAALKLKLERFPRLTNKDSVKLYDLADLLLEIQSLKADSKYGLSLSYFDSSTGVIPIVRKLPYNLQERWTSHASKYKIYHGVSFPPFSLFVNFVRDMSRIKNDPSFAHDQDNVAQKRDKLTNKTVNQRTSYFSKKTEIKPTYPATSQNKCPVHNSNHPLNNCRGFRKKTIQERKEFLRTNGICYRCCAANDHLAIDCKVNIECSLCHSDKHPTALHIENRTNYHTKPAKSSSSYDGEKELSKVDSKCTQICGKRFPGKSCSKNILVEVFPNGFPQQAKRMYVILDEQSNVSLARSRFFDIFDEEGETQPYTLSSCNGRMQTSGRRAKDYVVQALDGSGQINLLLREYMQDTTGWDEPLPAIYRPAWENWKEDLRSLEELQIPRVYTATPSVNREVRVYCDASEKAIAAVAYLQTTDTAGNRQIGFILVKAKLAPPQGHTIPRLELCAAVLAADIAEIVSEQLDIELKSFKFFSDSKIVLGYLYNKTRRFYVYVSNRVEHIRRISSPDQWNYVQTHLNPADAATRTSPPPETAIEIWLKGPSHTPSPPAADTFQLQNPDGDQEIRPQVTCLATTLSTSTGLGSSRFARFSSWKKLILTISRLKHIAKTFAQETNCSGWHICTESRSVTMKDTAELQIIQTVQREAYSQEIDHLDSNQPLPRNSTIRSLDPYLDADGILRVGGRLNKSSLNLQEKNPIIVPGKHHIASLIAFHYHETVFHQGRHFTEGAIRKAGFWITQCKRLISSLCHSCVKCRKLRANTCHQKMADLPVDRLTPAPPFAYVGVDAYGHWNVVTRRTRGGVANSKRWAIMFSCQVTRAIHVEIVESMSSSAFINSLRRFLSIRGKVKQFRSDRGTNFVGSTKDLGIQAINVEDEEVDKFLNDRDIEWIFNPPHSSHMGGSWERMIGVTRRILDSLLSEVSAINLTHDVLVTFMAEVCAIVNARPLVPVSSDPESPFILTPGTLLTQKSDFASYEPLAATEQRDQRDIYRSEWKRVQLLADQFWKRWRNEYLHTLQPRRKWIDNQPNLEIGDVVLLKDKNCHRNE